MSASSRWRSLTPSIPCQRGNLTLTTRFAILCITAYCFTSVNKSCASSHKHSPTDASARRATRLLILRMAVYFICPCLCFLHKFLHNSRRLRKSATLFRFPVLQNEKATQPFEQKKKGLPLQPLLFCDFAPSMLVVCYFDFIVS